MAIPEPLGKPISLFHITRSARLAVAVVCRVRRVWRQMLSLMFNLRATWKDLERSTKGE